MDIDHKYYFIFFFATLLVWVFCSKVIYKRLCVEATVTV